MKYFSAFWIALLCWNSCTSPSTTTEATTFPKSTSQSIDSLFQDFNQLHSPGYAIGISKGAETLYQKGYGSANLDYQLPIQPQSVFSIASVSKQFTAACVALLILDKKITLETPAALYLPRLHQYKDTIRLKHLIYNTSGLMDYHRLPRAGGKSWITFNYFDIDECIDAVLSQDTLLFAPGDQWDYCNINFMLLTKIVEKISGQTFSEFARQQLFLPLGMTQSFIHDDITTIITNRVTPYNLRTTDNMTAYREMGIHVKEGGDYIQHPRNAPHYGGSGVVTTIEDLMKWSQNMVTKTLGGEEFYELMHRTITFNHDRNNQAFGLYHGDFNGRKIVAWDGGDWGISSQLVRFPEQGIAIAVLSNLGSGRAYEKANQIADVLVEAGIIE